MKRRRRKTPKKVYPRPDLPCMIAGCTRRFFSRGVCAHCYAAYRSAIKSGAITEQQALERNMILPAKERFGGHVGRYKKPAAKEAWMERLNARSQ